MPEVLDWYGIEEGDNGEYLGSLDHRNWVGWHSGSGVETAKVGG